MEDDEEEDGGICKSKGKSYLLLYAIALLALCGAASAMRPIRHDAARPLDATMRDRRHRNDCAWPPARKKIGRDATITLSHPFLNTALGIVADIQYQVIVSGNNKYRQMYIASEDADGLPAGTFHPSYKNCSNVVQISDFTSNSSRILLNWTLPTSFNTVETSINFRLCYQLAEHNHSIYESLFTYPVINGCEFHVRLRAGTLSSTDLGSRNFNNCSLHFSTNRRQGVVVTLTRLNVRCNNGHLRFNKTVHLCGKLEEIPATDRQYYFDDVFITITGPVVFAITYQTVDYCYNVTLKDQNATVTINPLRGIYCNYRIALPYGYRVNGTVRLIAMDSDPNSWNGTLNRIAEEASDPICQGAYLRLWDGVGSRYYCGIASIIHRFTSSENDLRVRVAAGNTTAAEFQMQYEAMAVPELVRGCGFGSIAINSGVCVTIVDTMRTDYLSAEEECVRRGGHLVAIADEHTQAILNKFLIKSPGYQDQNSYWIGASDIDHEGEFHWTDSLPFSYTNWFGGWPLDRYYNRQPNDDGFSDQDCVELRRQYRVWPGGTSTNGTRTRLTATFTWNDRDCRTENYFLCETYKSNNMYVPDPVDIRKDCNQKITLTEDNGRAVISSPNFPRDYADNKNCLIYLTAPSAYNIVLVFEEFVLEDEPNCSYDYLEVFENSSSLTPTTHKFCGDWSDKLKLLKCVSSGPNLYLRFVSDYSYSFSGYKAHVSIEQVKTDCPDNRLQMFNSSCYLFVSYPQVTWQTAQDICDGVQGNLASVHSIEEEHFVVAKIRESQEYTTSTIYWLGGKFVHDDWQWVDNTTLTFTAWIPVGSNLRQSKLGKNAACLGVQWIPSPSSVLPSGLYWVPISCHKVGGYVCKIEKQVLTNEVNLNATASGTQGELSSPNFPGNYYHNLDYWIRIVGPDSTRIIIQFYAFDLEQQKDCLYDFLEIYNTSELTKPLRSCGHHHAHQLHRLNFVSSSNEALLKFHSDYSIAGSGFTATWKAVDISGCPVQTLTAKEGSVSSPNYPNFLLANLQCTTMILAPLGRQIWFQILDWDMGGKDTDENTDVHIYLDEKEKIRPLQDLSVLTDGAYLSYGEYVRIHLKTGDTPSGRGFKSIYKAVSDFHATRVISLKNNSIGHVYHLNFPLSPVPELHYVQRFIAPLGYSIHLQFHQVIPSVLDRSKGHTVCPGKQKGFIEVRDNFADRNGTWWQFCESNNHDVAHLTINSYLNVITITQMSMDSETGILLNASLSVVEDMEFKSKIVQFPKNYNVESCEPNPCNNNGKCVAVGSEKYCECSSHYTGLFCALTVCDVNPCLFGDCELTSSSFRCVCQPGYQGNICDKKVKPCSTNPCEGRGECVEKTDLTFTCQCHAWWEGERCEKKIMNIPYKPLSDRMLKEPFWLGILTVLVVLSVIGLIWCARKHFPEKLEKLLAEEAERNRHYGPSSCRSGAKSETVGYNGVATAVNASQSNTAASSPNPRTLLGRLGIRKPSLFSLTSPLQPTHTTRTFSLDDLFKPSSSSSQMSYKHRNSASHRKKSMDKYFLSKQSQSAEEKMESDRKSESIELKEVPKKTPSLEEKTEESRFVFPKMEPKIDDAKELSIKLEKKVHFARLLSKVQAEISTESDTAGSSRAGDKQLAASAQTLNGEPPSPRSTSSNQGSDSLSSSEVILATGEKLNSRRPSLLMLSTNGACQKAVSADSIFNMFRKFSLNAPECASSMVSASTSPTATSPPDELASDNTSVSSYHLTSSSIAESPPCKVPSTTIQVSVLDPLSSQKSISNISPSNLLHPPTIMLEVNNKLLSPIHEVPTPSPSPSISPIMPRHYMSSVQNNTSSSQDSIDVNHKCNDSVSVSSGTAPHTTPSSSETYPRSTPTSSDFQSDSSSGTKKLDLIIPSFIVEEPSPVNMPCVVVYPDTPTREFPQLHRADSNPPMITITCTQEPDSDNDSAKTQNAGMSYLSPFSMCSRADRTTSESNLSSSGYSSMASPGPSRCGSNNPLCPEAESSLQLRTPERNEIEVVPPSDCDTLSDEHQTESNDEGFATDHIDVKIKDGEVKSAKELEVLISSPVSSRSESPLSDRTAGLNRFSPMFYGRLTDSDGVYDWTSSDGLKPTMHRKHDRRKERHPYRPKSPKLTGSSPILLDVPERPRIRKPSPKRRVRSHKIIPSSSSSDDSTISHSSRGSPQSSTLKFNQTSSSITMELPSDDEKEDTLMNDGNSNRLTVPSFQSNYVGFLGKISSIMSSNGRSSRIRDFERNDPAAVPLLTISQIDEN